MGASAALALPGVAWRGLAAANAGAAGSRLRKFIEPLPVPGAGIVVATPTGHNRFSFTQREIRSRGRQ
jgi:hypothetical protein